MRTRPTLHAAVEVEAGHRFEPSAGERSVKAVLISPAQLQAFADHMRDESAPYFLAMPERQSKSVAHTVSCKHLIWIANVKMKDRCYNIIITLGSV